MKKIFSITAVVALLSVSATAVALPRWSKTDKGTFIEVKNEGGRTLGYNEDSGLKLLEVDGYAFKDLNRNGKLDIYEDWRRPSRERAEDLATQLSLDEIAGLMIYSSSLSIPHISSSSRKITYNNKPFHEAARSSSTPRKMQNKKPLSFLS